METEDIRTGVVRVFGELDRFKERVEADPALNARFKQLGKDQNPDAMVAFLKEGGVSTPKALTFKNENGVPVLQPMFCWGQGHWYGGCINIVFSITFTSEPPKPPEK
jgi:hypothetical protein